MLVHGNILKVRETVHHAIRTFVLPPGSLRIVLKLCFQIVLRVVPGEVNLLQADLVQVVDIPVRYHADIKPLIEANRHFRIGILLEKIVLLTAGRDVWVHDINVILSDIWCPEIFHVCHFDGASALFCGNI